MNRVLVTGANGLLGANVARKLLQNGFEVRAMVRPSADLRSLNGVDCEFFRSHLTSREDIDKAVRGCRYVVHSASNTSQYPTAFHHYESVNVESTKLIAEAVKRHQVERLVHVSTANCFGPGSLAEPGDELSEFSLFGYNSGYINSKFVSQQYVLGQAENAELPAIVVNPTFMLGPYDSKPSSGVIILQGLKSGIQLCPPGGKNFVHVRDVAAGIVQALKKGHIGQCYLLAGQNMSYADFYRLLNKVTGHKARQIRIPGPVLKGAGYLGGLWNRLGRTPVPLNYTNAKLLCVPNYYTAEKARLELDLPFTPVEQAIEEAVEWFKAEKALAVPTRVV